MDNVLNAIMIKTHGGNVKRLAPHAKTRCSLKGSAEKSAGLCCDNVKDAQHPKDPSLISSSSKDSFDDTSTRTGCSTNITQVNSNNSYTYGAMASGSTVGL